MIYSGGEISESEDDGGSGVGGDKV